MPLSISTNQEHWRIKQILDSNHPLCKNDVIWILAYIKKKVAEEDPQLQNLSQPRLLKNFHYFAEIAMLLANPRPFFDDEADRIKKWISEACFGLLRSSF